jgi:hypothetical protein
MTLHADAIISIPQRKARDAQRERRTPWPKAEIG